MFYQGLKSDLGTQTLYKLRFTLDKFAYLNISENNKLLFLAPQWSYKQVDKIKNSFWKDVVLAWANLLEITIEADRLNTPLWYNPKISKNPLF